MKWNCRFRCALIGVGFIGLFSIFSFRLIYLQMIKHAEMADKAAQTVGYKKTMYADRGDICDANGELLASNIPGKIVYADATRLNNIAATVELLGRELKIPS